jgi:hypothetical protein
MKKAAMARIRLRDIRSRAARAAVNSPTSIARFTPGDLNCSPGNLRLTVPGRVRPAGRDRVAARWGRPPAGAPDHRPMREKTPRSARQPHPADKIIRAISARPPAAERPPTALPIDHTERPSGFPLVAWRHRLKGGRRWESHGGGPIRISRRARSGRADRAGRRVRCGLILATVRRCAVRDRVLRRQCWPQAMP